MPRPERHDQILAELCRAYLRTTMEGQGGWRTRADLARAVGLKKSPHFTSILEELVSSGWVIQRRRSDRMQTYEYKASLALMDEYEAVKL